MVIKNIKQKSFAVDPTRVKEHALGTVKTGSVIYVMQRDQRVDDNWALLYGQQKAEELQQPLAVAFCIETAWYPKTVRHFDFMIKGLEVIEKELQKLHIPFYLLIGDAQKEVAAFASKHKVAVLVTDFNPLKYHQKLFQGVLKHLECAVYEVDAHNIVPCFVASQKQEYAARTIRPKIHKLLPVYLTEFPKLLKNTIAWPYKVPEIAWQSIKKHVDLDETVAPVDWIKPGELEAHKALKKFIRDRLNGYAEKRNNPVLQEGQSDLSPYLHFGHISAQRIALEVVDAEAPHADKEIFLEELIVRRELTDNYCYYNPLYDSVEGAAAWAQKTLKEHQEDPRDYVYTKKHFEDAGTHDELWNAAQLQLVHQGKMHGYMRMYWAKKILEWTATPEQAMKIALYLNDTYSLDGTDPNGYVGVAWSIAGVHDRAWFPRKVFGTIRYMNYNGCKSKFDVIAYCKAVLKSIKKA